MCNGAQLGTILRVFYPLGKYCHVQPSGQQRQSHSHTGTPLPALCGVRALSPLRAVRGSGHAGQAPLGRLVVKTEMLQTVHQLIQPLPLLVDDLAVVGQGVEQCLSLGHKQAPGKKSSLYFCTILMDLIFFTIINYTAI